MSSSRRDFLKAVAAVGGTSVSNGALLAKYSEPANSAATDEQTRPPFRLIWEGEWNDIPCTDYPLTPERWAEEAMAPLVNTHVDALAYNLCSSDGYVCDLKSGELLCQSVKKFDDSWYWRYRANTKKLIEAGANPPDLAVKYGRMNGLKIFPVIRMNDPHDQYYAFRYEVSDFKKNHPQYLLGHPHWEEGVYEQKEYPLNTMESFTWGLFDFSHKAVRDHKLAIINEFATRWENDGVLLDFERDPMYFWPPKGGGTKRENQEKMSDVIRSVRATLDKVAVERGKEQLLMVKVLQKIEVSQDRGLDVSTWVKEGLVQVIIPGAGDAPMTLHLRPWLKLVEGKKCWINAANNQWKPSEQTRAWALQVLDQGAHGLYLFNWGHPIFGFRADQAPPPPLQGRNWWQGRNSVRYREVHPDFYTALSEVGDSRVIQFKNKRYVLDSCSHQVEQGQEGKLKRLYRAIDDVVLPLALPVGEHEVPFRIGDDLESAGKHGFNPSVRLHLLMEYYTYPNLFDIYLNDTPLNNGTRAVRDAYPMNNLTRVEYTLPAKSLRRGENTLKIQMHRTNPEMGLDPVVQNVEITIDYS